MKVDAMVPQGRPVRVRAIPGSGPLGCRPPMWSDAVRLDVDLSGRHVDHAPGPDFDRVHPRELGVVAHQRNMLAQLEDRRTLLRNRHASRFQRDSLAVLGRDLPVNVQFGAAVGAEVDVVHAYERALELGSADRPLEIEVEARALRWWL